MKVFGDMQSGNCYKVKLLLSFLKIEHSWQHIDVLNAETKTPEFLKMNPNGKIPVVVLDDARVLTESNAILGYFAENTPFIPTDRYAKAKMYEWMFFEQYSHEPCIAVARFINKYLGLPEDRLVEYQRLQPKGHQILAIMEQALHQRDYLLGDSLTLADISLYAYTHVADEGGFDLSLYPHIVAWCARVQQQPNYIAMNAS
ncbi:glutathione S-transferase family protein [Acinetobacter sp. MD2(2019)]|uniref:glutathione S-transferase family protein n=1 Tax=Acinetobacter sp. MD2(2019) TaxID=2605273 RepID=UPI002D1E807E|nr:glutathione S-transferase family protein [Acinetobacter sp. MD2(2019)]MEB3754469.1 glutathione S-transferase family protein [Acinetobacter sp. MD2(2019)]